MAINMTANKSTIKNQIPFEVLACPLCKGNLRYNKKAQELICNFDRLAFPIKSNIPVMLVSEARIIKNK
jgi:uncharacterized protein